MLAKLEDEMVTWDPKTSDDSPDRIDALVHALTDLLAQDAPPSYVPTQGLYKPRR
jgi:phage terminase large subunit-like protein